MTSCCSVPHPAGALDASRQAERPGPPRRRYGGEHLLRVQSTVVRTSAGNSSQSKGDSMKRGFIVGILVSAALLLPSRAVQAAGLWDWMQEWSGPGPFRWDGGARCRYLWTVCPPVEFQSSTENSSGQQPGIPQQEDPYQPAKFAYAVSVTYRTVCTRSKTTTSGRGQGPRGEVRSSRRPQVVRRLS